jgi:hypothetical protein
MKIKHYICGMKIENKGDKTPKVNKDMFRRGQQAIRSIRAAAKNNNKTSDK